MGAGTSPQCLEALIEKLDWAFTYAKSCKFGVMMDLSKNNIKILIFDTAYGIIRLKGF